MPDRRAPLVHAVLRPFQQFASAESASGIVLLSVTVVALAWANSPWSPSYFALWERELAISVGAAELRYDLRHWINDGLMAVFFFLVGLEIKRELLVGELASVRQAALPVAGALGGMLVPALLFTLFNFGGAGAHGWGIPMATDIAFALGVVTLMGQRVPVSLKIFIVALAIADDIGAVIVIAVFYTAELSATAAGVAVAILAFLVILNRLGIRQVPPYALLGVLLWFAMLKSGVHATIAGVLLAATIPSRTRINEDEFFERARAAVREFGEACGPGVKVLASRAQQESIHALEQACADAQGPLLALEHRLNETVAYVIMPLFALANAGVAFSAATFESVSWQVVLGIVFGLVIGKPLGITLFAWLAVRSGMAAMPSGATWRTLHGVSWLGGIGFTMSLFISGLAFGTGGLLDSAKVGILTASVLAGAVGWLLLSRTEPALETTLSGDEPGRVAVLAAAPAQSAVDTRAI